MGFFPKKYRFLLIGLLAIILAGGFFVWQMNKAQAQYEAAPQENVSTNVFDNTYDSTGPVDTSVSKENRQKSGIEEVSAGGILVDMTLKGMSKLVGYVMFLVFTFLGWFVEVASKLLEASFKIEQFRGVPIVETGWNITRGLCNMFFALILLVMSFSTILRIEEFGAKRLLWKLTVSILLINFSLVIAGIVIDFSQILTHYFIDAAGGLNNSISEQLMNGLNLSRVYQVDGSAEEIGNKMAADANGLIQVAGGLFFGIIIMLLAVFTLLAGAVFLIFRVVVLWVLLIAAPLAWLSRTLGGGMGKIGQFWGEWWSEFFRWTFFAPTYAFFIYLATTAVGSGGIEKAFQNAQSVSVKEGFFSGLLANIKFFLQYIVVIIFLLIGIMSAQKLGGAAGGAMATVSKKMQGWGKKAVGAEQGFGHLARRTLGRPFDWAYDTLAPKTVGLAGAMLPGKTGYRLQAKATQMKTEEPMKRTWHKDYEKKLKSMGDDGLLYEVEHAYGIRKYLAAKAAQENGLLGRTENKKVVKEAMKALNAYGVKDDEGKTDAGKNLERSRLDVATDIIRETVPENKQEETIKKLFRKSKDSGHLTKLHKNLFKNDANIFEGILKTFNPAEITDIYNSWNKETKEAAKKSTKDVIDGKIDFGFEKDEQIKQKLINDLRSRRADFTGNLNESFGTADFLTRPENKTVSDLATEYIQQMGPRQIGNIRGNDEDALQSLELIGSRIERKVVESIRGELSGFQKDKILKSVQKYQSGNEKLLDYLQNTPAWGGTRKIATKQQSPESEQQSPEPKVKIYSAGAPVPPPRERKA